MTKVIRSAAAVALMAMGAISAQAQVQNAEAGFAPDITQAQSQLTRQQVVNQLVAARQSGQLQLGYGDVYAPINKLQSASALSRQQVQVEAVATSRQGNANAAEGSVQ